ncbi:MAG: ABC transporter permease, partial [Brevundimonas sp.]
MNRTLLIARREYGAYARTVGFWLSLLAFPMFAVLGGAVPIMIRSSEPVRAVAVVEEGPQAAGLAAAVRDSLRNDAERRNARARETAEKAAASAGASANPGMAQGAMANLSRPRLRLVATPTEISSAPPGPGQDAAVRRYLTDDTPKDQRLDAVVFLNRADGKPTARVWTARATDDTVEDFIRDAMNSANRKTVFETAGIDPGVVDQTEAFRAEVSVFSPKSASGGEVSFRDKLPAIIGLASGFLLWSLIITGASILLNSVM